MRTTDKHLSNLPVYSTTEALLGYIAGLEIDVDTHSITKYFVAEHKLVPEVLRSLVGVAVFEISPSQVVTIRQDRMIVQDTLVHAKATSTSIFSAILSQPSQ